MKARLAAPAAEEDGGCGADALTRFCLAGRLRPPQAAQPRAAGSLRAAPEEPLGPRRPPRPPGPAARRRGARRSALRLASRRGASRPVPAQQPASPGSRGHRALRPGLPARTHYLPQANVARDGQSEGQCHVLHGLSHGSVQNPANTEVPPTAAPRHAGGRARPATAAWQGHGEPGGRGDGNALLGRAVAPSVFVFCFFLSLLNNHYY